MRILVTGSNGQLGRSLQKLAPSYPGFDFTWTDLAELDITDVQSIERFVMQLEPEIVVNCAAYTAVDKAEEEPRRAMMLNGHAPGMLAEAAEAHGGRLIHISTDYVFSGKGSLPYTEKQACQPVSTYGLSKREGEQQVLTRSDQGLIIRTSWLYSEFGHNFVKTMLRLGQEGHHPRVVADQYGCPTYASDLARAILDMIPLLTQAGNQRIFHYANTGITTWHGLANLVMQTAGLDIPVIPIRTEDFPTLAARPAYSVLDTTLITKTFDMSIPGWEESLQHCIKILREEESTKPPSTDI